LQWLGSFPLLSGPKVTEPLLPLPAGSVAFDGIISTYDIPLPTTGNMFFRLSQ
jgi:hypothetical protein